MTTNTERVTQLIGELHAVFIDQVPDAEVKSNVKELVHVVLDNGPIPPGMIMSGNERRVWELIELLGIKKNSDPWGIEQTVAPLIDSYDLFSD